MWMLFIGELRRRWLEYALGALAVAAVVATLVSQRALTASAEEKVHDLAHRLGRNMLVLPSTADAGAFHAQRFGKESLADTAPDTIRASELGAHIRMIEARLYGEVQVGAASVIVVGQDFAWPPSGDAHPAVLGESAARALGVGAGQTFRIGDAAFQVLQVSDAPPDGLDGAVFMPLAAAQHVLGRPGQLSALRLGGCWCRIDVATLARDIETLLPGTRAITAAGMIQAQQGSIATMKRYSGALHATGLAVVALVVAALVASQARRRSRELGLLVAIGAPPRHLAWLFTLQAAIAGAVGGALGWGLAVPATRYLGEALLGSVLTPPSGLLAPAIALTAVVSAVAASIPARRAAALDPTVVLRES
jgi:putative ABC transport system permease protein